MRTMVNRGIGPSLFILSALGACQPLPVGGGQFWTGVDDGGLAPEGPIIVDPTGSGGDIGSGGVGAFGGATGSAGASGTGAGTGSGGAAGDGSGAGGVAGSGGGTGSGGLAGSAGGGGSEARGGATGAAGAAGRGGAVGTGGRGGSGGTSGSAGSSGALSGMLMVSVTTKAAGGRYAPDNVGAIWIADGNTRFVKSLYVWGQQRRRELTRWTSATSAAGLANNLVDAVTAATMRSHGLRTATWNGTGTTRAPVADGPYKVCFELEDGASQYQCVDFTKGRSPQTLMPANTTSFTSRMIGYTP